MIKRNDLRLGNWVEMECGGKGSGKRSIPMQVAAFFYDTVYLDFEGNEGDVWEEDDKNLIGVPLTKEVLNNCCTKKHFGYFALKELNGNVELQPIRGGGYNLFFAGRYIRPIRFVHELQNIYFALTGEGLVIKL